MKFDIQHTAVSTSARAGVLHTAHGEIRTPIFMPVGTVGSVKGVHQRELADEVRAQIILGNTYHLYLRPGTDILQKAGGLHRFIGWDRPILTDSGGYQVYSLSATRKIREEGVRFKSHIDGSAHLFSPESVMGIQRKIGADIIMAFDECTPYPCEYSYAKASMHMTHRWLDRCVAYLKENPELYGYPQSLVPIVQGSVYPDLRRMSAEKIASVGADGNAIGGLSVGEPHEVMYETIETVCAILPADRPRYLMGVGTPVNILEAIDRGIDMLDCVMPTRNARNGMLFTAEGTVNIKNRKWADDFSPVDPAGYTWVDTAYTRAYLRHLFAADEFLGKQIASIHNLGFYLWLVGEARRRIVQGDFARWKAQMVEKLDRRL